MASPNEFAKLARNVDSLNAMVEDLTKTVYSLKEEVRALSKSSGMTSSNLPYVSKEEVLALLREETGGVDVEALGKSVRSLQKDVKTLDKTVDAVVADLEDDSDTTEVTPVVDSNDSDESVVDSDVDAETKTEASSAKARKTKASK